MLCGRKLVEQAAQQVRPGRAQPVAVRGVVFELERDDAADVRQQRAIGHAVGAGVDGQDEIPGAGNRDLLDGAARLVRGAAGLREAAGLVDGATRLVTAGGASTRDGRLARGPVAHCERPAGDLLERRDPVGELVDSASSVYRLVDSASSICCLVDSASSISGGGADAARVQGVPVRVVQPVDGGDAPSLGLDGALDDGAGQPDELQVVARGQHREAAPVGDVEQIAADGRCVRRRGDDKRADPAVDEPFQPFGLRLGLGGQAAAGGHDEVSAGEPSPRIGQVAGVRPGDEAAAAPRPGQVAQPQRSDRGEPVHRDHSRASERRLVRASRATRRAEPPR